MTTVYVRLIFMVVTLLISLYAFWQHIMPETAKGSLKFRNGRPVLPEHVFDTWLFSVISAHFFSRFMFIISNWGEYQNTGWSLRPWEREGSHILWFMKLPWILFNVFERIDAAWLIVGFFLCFLLILFIQGIKLRKVWNAFILGMTVLIFGIIAMSVAMPVAGVTGSALENKDIYEFFTENIAFVEIVAVMGVFLVVRKYFINNEKQKIALGSNFFKLDFLIFSGFLSVVLLVMLSNVEIPYPMHFLAAVPLLLGILEFFFASKDLGIEEIPVKEDLKPKGKLKIKVRPTGRRK